MLASCHHWLQNASARLEGIPPSGRYAAAYPGLKRATLERWRCYGGGPVFHKLGGRCFYLKEDLDAFAQARRRRSTSDMGPEDGRPGAN